MQKKTYSKIAEIENYEKVNITNTLTVRIHLNVI